MKYNLNKLNPYDFEHLVQSLTKAILGNGSVSFGDGADGGREATFNGKAPYPSKTECWEGYWVIQAKFKNIHMADHEKDYSWLKDQLKKELDKYFVRQTKVKKPDNYLLFTNVILTAKAETGGRDRATKLEREFERMYKIKNIRIIAYNDIQDFLDSNRDIAITYLPFILAGDVLYKLLEFLNIKLDRRERINEIISRFFEVEFKEDIQSKLDHAGKLTSDKINLEKVFIDLYATENGLFKESDSKFIDSIIRLGNSILKGRQNLVNRYALIAGPGYGKSTLTQFLTQIYRAYFLKNIDKCDTIIEEVDLFINDYNSLIEIEPSWIRLPIKITLKEYAGWIRELSIKEKSLNVSVIEYIKFNINKKSSTGDLTNEEIEYLIQNLPCLFIFDGLDEVPASSNREEVLKEINIFTDTILRRINSDSIIVSTSRPQGYSKEFDNSKYRHLYIADLEKQDCKVYLSKLLTNIIDNSTERSEKLSMLLKALEHNEISRLMKSPLQASIMAILVKSGGEPPRNKFDLFTDYYNIIFRREKQRNISRILSDNPEYIKDIHNKLGFYLQAVSENDTNPSATIKIEEFKKIIVSYLKELGVEHDDITKITHEILETATDRLVFISELEAQKIGFAIRSLQEYFAANGYIHNVSDEEIRNRIKAISKNSYWSNTLLFGIGYISKNKNYLVDCIESVCNVLNGSTDEKGSKSLNSISKMGSWLALDILNEGIFRGNPKNENIFCNLLKPLFYIAPNQKHEELAKLPNKLIEKWIKKYIEEVFSLSINNLTVWHICLTLCQNNIDVLEIIKDNWPVEIEEQNQVVRVFIDNKFYPDFIIKKFIDLIALNSRAEFWNIFGKRTNYDLWETICRYSGHTLESKAILIEILFIVSLSDYHSGINYRQLYGLLGIHILKSEDPDPSLLFLKRKRVEMELVVGYTVSIYKLDNINSGVIKDFRLLTAKYKIILIDNICNFLIDSSYINLLKMNTYIQLLDEEYKKIILTQIKYTSSLFYYIYNLDEIPNEGDFNKSLNELKTIKVDTLKPDVKNKLIDKYMFSRTLHHGDSIRKLKNFVNTYFNTTYGDLFYYEYAFLFNWLFIELDKNELNRIQSESELIISFKSSLKSYFVKNYNIDFTKYISSFYLLKTEDIHLLLLDQKLESRFEILSYNIGYLERSVNKLTISDSLKKIIDVVKYEILIATKPAYKSLLQIIIIHLELLKTIDYGLIPFTEILKYKAEQEVEIYKAIILLLNRQYDEIHHQEFVKIIELNVDVFSNEEFVKSLLFILKHSINNEWIDRTLLFIDTCGEWDDIQSISEFENYIKQYVGNKSTNIELKNFKPIKF